MKKLVLNLAVILFTASNVFSQTTVPGGAVNGTWTLAGSPYNVTGSIQIVNGDVLHIEPGVEVNFKGTYKLLVLGQLLAEGTAYDYITFTATDTSGGWRGIRFDKTPNTNDTSRISYCKIEYGKATGSVTPEQVGGGIYISEFSKVVVSNSFVEHCFAHAIYIIASSPIIINNSISHNIGSGICIASGHPTIINNKISNNYSDGGAGIYIGYLSPYGNATVLNNTVTFNIGGDGGGILIDHGNPIVQNNIISYNIGKRGGGINVSGHAIVSNNIISNNYAESIGGGMFAAGGTINNNVILNNTSEYSGGGIECNANNIVITNNKISNNRALSGPVWHFQGGGGISCISGFDKEIIISNNLITNNSASNGGGIICYNSSPIFTNNTIANNSASNNGGALSCSGSSPVFNNCILWGNTATTSGSQVFLYDEGCDPNFNYCDVQGGNAGFELNGNFYTGTYTNNINKNPLFVYPSAGSGVAFDGDAALWTLQYTSPCKNRGNPVGTYPSTDIAGNTRVINGIIDIGAYEFVSLITDAGAKFNSPANLSYCGTLKLPIVVELTNYGNDTLKNADLSWKLNGAFKKKVSWAGLLAPYQTALVNVDSSTFVVGNTYDVESYSSKPNFISDIFNVNDTAKTNVTMHLIPDASYTNTVINDTVVFARNNISSATSMWQFGDGNSSTQNNPSHIYTHARAYNVTHIITSANGCSAIYEDSVNVLVASIKSFSKSHNLLVYPNPFNAATTIQYNLAKPSEVTINIYDLSGKLINSSNLGLMSSGNHTSMLDVSKLLAGAYLLKVDAEDVNMYCRLLKN